MKSKFIVFLIFLLSPGLLWCKNKSLETKIDEYLQPYLTAKTFSGAVLIAQGGKVLFEKGYGMANYELDMPNTPKSRFHLASISKTFTSAAIMILQERGKLSPEDNLTKFIPDYPNGQKIKVHHLLSDSSGIPNINNFPEYQVQVKLPHKLEEIIAMFKDRPLEFNPGERDFSESSANWVLLAYIIEKVSGQSYGEFLRQNIWEPLGMNDTGHHSYGEMLIPNRASGYQPVGLDQMENAPYIDWSFKTGNASIFSTVEDLHKWDRALNTEKILKKGSIAEMFSKHYGWFSGKRLNRNVVRYSGRSPGFQCEIHRYIDDHAFVAVLSNNYSTTASIIVNDLAAILFGEKYEIPQVVPPRKLPDSALRKFAGRYQFGNDFYVPNGVYDLRVVDGVLWAEAREFKNALVPQSGNEFLERMFWARMVFHSAPNGEITDFVWRYGTESYTAKKIGE